MEESKPTHDKRGRVGGSPPPGIVADGDIASELDWEPGAWKLVDIDGWMADNTGYWTGSQFNSRNGNDSNLSMNNKNQQGQNQKQKQKHNDGGILS